MNMTAKTNNKTAEVIKGDFVKILNPQHDDPQKVPYVISKLAKNKYLLSWKFRGEILETLIFNLNPVNIELAINNEIDRHFG